MTRTDGIKQGVVAQARLAFNGGAVTDPISNTAFHAEVVGGSETTTEFLLKVKVPDRPSRFFRIKISEML